jgi:hypothetical protein
MATRRSHRHVADSAERPAHEEHTVFEGSTSVSQESNGAGAGSAAQSEAPGETGPQTVMQRAEETADHLGERIRHYASVVGFQILRFAARVKEEAEDIWAEAQCIRRGGPPSETPADSTDT